MKIYFLRHAQAESNVKKAVNDSLKRKINLTGLGKKQAQSVAKKLKIKKLDAIFSSQFPRCLQTAMIINRFHGLKIKKDKRLDEWDTGFDGKSYEELNEFLEKDRIKIKVKGHESFKDVQKRINSFMHWLENQDYKIVLIITHEASAQAINAFIKKISAKEIFKKKIPNAKVFFTNL